MKLTQPNKQIEHFIPIDYCISSHKVDMSLSFSRYTVRFRANHRSPFAIAIANFHPIFRLVFLLENIDVGFSALIFRVSSIRSFIIDGFFGEVKASSLSVRDGKVSITPRI